jgi:hypothetical protein
MTINSDRRRTASPAKFLALLALLALGSCQPDPRSGVDLEEIALREAAPPGHEWLTCPGGGTGQSHRKRIGAAGDTILLDSGHLLVVPPDAVSAPRTFTLREPASPQVFVIATDDQGTPFQRDVSLVISYARCQQQVDPARLRMFRVRADTMHDDLNGRPGEGRTFRSDQLSRLSNFALASAN